MHIQLEHHTLATRLSILMPRVPVLGDMEVSLPSTENWCLLVRTYMDLLSLWLLCQLFSSSDAHSNSVGNSWHGLLRYPVHAFHNFLVYAWTKTRCQEVSQ